MFHRRVEEKRSSDVVSRMTPASWVSPMTERMTSASDGSSLDWKRGTSRYPRRCISIIAVVSTVWTTGTKGSSGSSAMSSAMRWELPERRERAAALGM